MKRHVNDFSTDGISFPTVMTRDREDLYRDSRGRKIPEAKRAILEVMEVNEFIPSSRPSFLFEIEYHHNKDQFRSTLRLIMDFLDSDNVKVVYHSGDPVPDGFLENEYILDHLIYFLRRNPLIELTKEDWEDQRNVKVK